jgi:hypothetical protein
VLVRQYNRELGNSAWPSDGWPAGALDIPFNRAADRRAAAFRVQPAKPEPSSLVLNAPQHLPKHAKVVILLATKNGCEFLPDQLQSYCEQSHPNWELIVPDDGSVDQTAEIVKRFTASVPRKVSVRKGPCQGFHRNFMSLAGDPKIDADLFAFSDQDDIWSADKLERGVNWLASIPEWIPAVYCGRTELMDRWGVHKGYSQLYAREPSFQNALVQNIGGGNTMMFNRATKKLLEATATADMAAYDWWTYQITTAAGGIVYYDPQPCLKYRQHKGNLIGCRYGVIATSKRIYRLFSGSLVGQNDNNITALQRIRPLLTPANRATIDRFAEGRRSSLLRRLHLLMQTGVYRQGMLENLGLFIGFAFRRI